MTRPPVPPRPARAALLGAIGGAGAGLAALAVLVAGGWAVPAGPGSGRGWAVPLNAVGATAVRWLQIGQGPAFEGLYPDATPLGALLVVAGAALGGAVLAALLCRAPAEPRLAWSMAAAVAGWAAVRFALAPALDPALLRAVDGRVLLAAWLAWGAAVAVWLEAMRRLPA